MLTKLSELIQNKAKNTTGCSSDCVYLNSDKINIASYTDIKFYSAQSGEKSTKITFSNYPYQISFCSNIIEKFEDRKSFEKYGGLIYIFEPLTDDLANIILSTLK